MTLRTYQIMSQVQVCLSLSLRSFIAQSTNTVNSGPAEHSPAFANSVDPDQLASEEVN